MKGYKRFIIAFILAMALYVAVEMNLPKPLNWNISLSKEDKNPYGGFIVYHQLKDLFPGAMISSHRLPVYNQVNNLRDSNTAYILIDPNLGMSGDDLEELMDYVKSGNYVFMVSGNFSKVLMDTLKFTTARRFDIGEADSMTINFVNPSFHSPANYGFKRMTLEGYLNTFDTVNAILLGNNHLKDINFIKMPFGKGAFYIHSLPLSFSNYFIVTGRNAEYTSKALSYLPENIHKIFWDEYYKLGPTGSQNPLRFILNDPWLKWAFYIGIITMALFILFEMKRTQRIIPVIMPLSNSSLDFVQTVGSVYFNQRDNRNIADKKIVYFLEHLRNKFYLQTNELDDAFVLALSKKTGVEQARVQDLINLLLEVQNSADVSDEMLLRLNKQVDDFSDSIR